MNKIDYNNRTFNEEIEIEFDNKKIQLDVYLKGLDGKPDCQIGHFGYNFYFRTPYGTNRKKYKSVNTMKRDIEKVLKNNNINIIKWIKLYA